MAQTLKRMILAAVLGAIQVEAQTYAQTNYYSKFALAMAPYELEFTWEPV